MTQPAVSGQVAHLERELGQKLLNRQYHRLTLTAAGQETVRYAQTVVNATEGLLKDLHQQPAKPAALMIGLYLNEELAPIAQMFQHFSQLFDIPITIDRSTGWSSLDRLTNHQFDVVLAIQRDYPGIEWLTLCDDQLVAWLPADDPLVNEKFLTVDQLKGKLMIKTSIVGTADYDSIQQDFIHNHDFETITVHSLSATFYSLQTNNSFAILPKTSFTANDKIKPVPLKIDPERSNHFQIGLAYLAKNHSASVDAFIHYYQLMN